jgi:hypothetical protein
MEDFILNKVERTKIIEMLKKEQTIRYSKGIQEAYTSQYYVAKDNSEYEMVSIEREIQKYILRQFGFKDDEHSLNEYWKIPSAYWHDEEVKNSIFYMKLNIFQYPKVSVGDDLIDAQLIDYQTNQEMSLTNVQKQGRPLIILAGSMT